MSSAAIADTVSVAMVIVFTIALKQTRSMRLTSAVASAQEAQLSSG